MSRDPSPDTPALNLHWAGLTADAQECRQLSRNSEAMVLVVVILFGEVVDGRE